MAVENVLPEPEDAAVKQSLAGEGVKGSNDDKVDDGLSPERQPSSKKDTQGKKHYRYPEAVCVCVQISLSKTIWKQKFPLEFMISFYSSSVMIHNFD